MSIKDQEQKLASFRNFEGGIGWQPLQAALFRLCLTKYGCGNWDTISYFLPEQNTAQFNTFTQKLFGQQSLAAFSGMKLDPYDVYSELCTKPGKLRKNGVVTHEGPPLTREQKAENKEYYKKKQKLIDFEIPIVENRSRNYSKLHCQMEYQDHVVEKVLAARGRKNAHLVEYKEGEFPNFDEFLDPFPEFPSITNWNFANELKCPKGQDNLWPLIRLVENKEWLQADQCLHWNFLSGRTMKKAKEASKKVVKGDGKAYKDTKRPARVNIPKGKKDVEMSESNEAKAKLKLPSVDQWTTDNLCDF
eukprot:UN28033